MNFIEPPNDEVPGPGRDGLTDRQLKSLQAIVYLVLLVMGVVFVFVKLWQIPIVLQEFKFTDFIALALALFTIWLSSTFLTSSMRQNNQLYSSTSTFTREMVTLLSRLDRDVRERLERLDGHVGPSVKTSAESDIGGQKAVTGIVHSARAEILREIETKLSLPEREQLAAEIRERDLVIEEARDD